MIKWIEWRSALEFDSGKLTHVWNPTPGSALILCKRKKSNHKIPEPGGEYEVQASQVAD